MEIGGMGIRNTNYSSKTRGVSVEKEIKGNSNLFAGIMNGQSSILESGKRFEDTKNADVDQRSNSLEGQLNLSGEELSHLLNDILNKLDSELNSEEVMNVFNDNHEMYDKDVIMGLLETEQEISNSLGKEFGQALKTIKLLDLLSANQDSINNQTKIREFLKSINEKLEISLNTTNFSNKNDLLQKVFSSLAEEMNSKKTQETSSILTKSESLHHGFLQIQHISKPEQLTILNQSGKQVSADQFIEQFESILSKSHFLKNGSTQKLFIKLNPDHLGALRVELIQKDSILIARILTSTSAAKDLLDSQINGLKQAFSSQNLQVERLEISQQMTQQERSFNRDPQHGHERQQKGQDEQKQQHDNGFNQSFEEVLLNTEV